MARFRLVLGIPGIIDPDKGLEFYSATINAESADSQVLKSVMERIDRSQAAGGPALRRMEQFVTTSETDDDGVRIGLGHWEIV
ncbi:hypothetical protein SEA_PUPPER_230 [Gordonia phage Pupper]|uniref:Uncharacterized protein n=1 Tax=Gordonia phage Pupper TaxID=2571249 RepID=A0A4Y6EJ07_9CAUD|nr:hypothetical protein KHQ83_gp047 [Gordonia phage Pupper]QDF18716.1 hypothetical protein SEA_PUPPER_230 [Gordonia phage Pupper]